MMAGVSPYPVYEITKMEKQRNGDQPTHNPAARTYLPAVGQGNYFQSNSSLDCVHNSIFPLWSVIFTRAFHLRGMKTS